MKKLMVNKNYYGKRRLTHVADSTDVQTEMQFGQSKIDKCKYPKKPLGLYHSICIHPVLFYNSSD